MKKEEFKDETGDFDIIAEFVNDNNFDLLLTKKIVYVKIRKYLGLIPISIEIKKLTPKETDVLELDPERVKIRRNGVLLNLTTNEDFRKVSKLIKNEHEQIAAHESNIEKKNNYGMYPYDTPLEKTKKKQVEEEKRVIPKLKSPRRNLHKNWNTIAKEDKVYIYDKVVEAILPLFKNNKLLPPPTEALRTEKIVDILRTMYGKELKNSSLKVYANKYRRYIVKTYIDPTIKKEMLENATEKTEKKILPLNDKIKEMWDMLPGEFNTQNVKNALPANTHNIPEAAADAINQFLTRFECSKIEKNTYRKGK